MRAGVEANHPTPAVAPPRGFGGGLADRIAPALKGPSTAAVDWNHGKTG
jgi:hypothetical protein